VRPLFQTVTNLETQAEILRRRPYGMIEARDGRVTRVQLRPFPKLTSVPEVLLFGGWYHRWVPGDRCWLHYNQPRQHSNFLAVKCLLTTRDTQVATVRRAVEALDEIARIKQSDALMCDAANWRLSTAIMNRWGWESYCPSRWHRYFIRRFYGTYPPKAAWLVAAAPAVEVQTGLAPPLARCYDPARLPVDSAGQSPEPRGTEASSSK
jgi:hypothetical protein